MQVNGHNVTYSTHDEVVNIVRKSGGTLRMKVVTPMTKPKSVSQQIKQQMTPVSTPESNRKATANEESPQLVFKSSILGELGDEGRETVIGGDSDTLPHPRRSSPHLSRSSPYLSRSPPPQRTGSQEDVSGSLTKSTVTKAYPIPQRTTVNQSDHRPTDGRGKVPLSDRSKSFTLPPRDYPRAGSDRYKDFADSSQSEEEQEEEEDESPFAKALRERKNELAKRSAEKLRVRANTMPEKNSPLLVKKAMKQNQEASEPIQESEDEPTAGLSPLQMELLKASKKRSERMEMNQPRLTKSNSEFQTKEQLSVSNNPLANALSKRINSFTTAKVESDGDDFESSPGSSPVQSPTPVKTKLPPPTVRPKPSKKNRPEAGVRRSESPVNLPTVSEESSGSLSFKVTLQSWSQTENKMDADVRRSESPVNVSVISEKAVSYTHLTLPTIYSV